MNTLDSSCLKTLNLVSGSIDVNSTRKLKKSEHTTPRVKACKKLSPTWFSLKVSIDGWKN